MIITAAGYARKSTSQDGVADEARSVTRQIENIRAFAAKNGWRMAEGHIYVDDGVSGAALRKLVERQRMLDLIYSGRAPFQVLIVQAPDRLSRRDGDESFAELKKIAQAGVEVWFYAKGERFTFGDFKSNVTGILEGEFAAEFRRAITTKTEESLVKKFRDGFATGNLPFGYVGVRTPGGVKAQVHEPEAEVVRRIYQMAADGVGLKKISHALNAAGLASPRAQQGRIEGWCPSSVRSVLLRPIYRGDVVYRKTKKRDRQGDEVRSFRPESDWMQRHDESLRIVLDSIAKIVDERYGSRRDRYLRGAAGRLLGRPSTARYLLTGLIKCPTCGGNFEAQTRPHGNRPGGVYMCSVRLRKGPSKCSSTLTLPIQETEQSILATVQREMLDQRFIERVLDSAFADAPAEDRAGLVDERARIAREIENLTAAIAAGGDIPALAAALKDRDKRLRLIDAKLAPREEPNRERLRSALLQRVAEWKEILQDHRPQARQVIQRCVGQINLAMTVGDYNDILRACGLPEQPVPQTLVDFQPAWAATFDGSGLLAGLDLDVASPTGFEPVFWP